jgi:ATP-dependent helicase/nuclease subunit A
LNHVVIRASAGSGKTHRLTNRYLLLLAAEVGPLAILATTFTRKAAGEILNRVLERLSNAAQDRWEAQELARQIGLDGFDQGKFAALLRQLLRNLHLARIGTLDSFTLSLARAFSLELGLPASWSICEEAEEAALHAEALEGLLEQHAEAINELIPLLTKGEIKRSTHGELQNVIKGHYEAYLGSHQSAWNSLCVPLGISEEDRATALAQLCSFDFSACGHKKFIDAQNDDIAAFENQDWKEFLSTGLAARVLAGETKYCGKPIPPAAQAIYETLIKHARAEAIGRLARQSRATWEILDRYHHCLRALKQTTGQIRFGDATKALADGFERNDLREETVAYRFDGAVDHLLLDEFQDTSLDQWRVLETLALGITRAPKKSRRSFFCVGDVKQAIYGWRGGMARIFNALQTSLGNLSELPLTESQRSAQPIIDVVNQVFGQLLHWDGVDKCQPGIAAWSGRFEEHTTAKKKLRGYVCLHTGPAQLEGQKLPEHRAKHCHYVAGKVRDIFDQAPACTVGVLCRTNDIVARMIYELRGLGIEASEEGGNPLTDSAAVELVLSLLALADHPGHSAAWFHLQNSPLKEELESFADAERLSGHLRRELLVRGYGPFMYSWAKQLAPACNRRDLSRLQQLVEMAYDYQVRSTLRADDFIARVRELRVPDPLAANVRVMTIHAAKGLQFDVTVLPDLDAGLTGRPPPFVARRNEKSLRVELVCRYADESVQKLLTQDEQRAFEQDLQGRIEESLSVLYVAMTRAKLALHLYIPGPRQRGDSKAWYNLLLQALVPGTQPAQESLLFEHGDRYWFRDVPSRDRGQVVAQAPQRVSFRPASSDRWRGLKVEAPSQREGRARLSLSRLFNPSEAKAMVAGTLYHAWFATIEWLEDDALTQDSLRATAAKIRTELSAEVWRDLDKYLANFRAWLQNAEIAAILKRAGYAGPGQPGFPTALAPLWRSGMGLQKVERERHFLVHDGTTFLNGSLDRIVWIGDGKRTVGADVLDFKTDTIAPDDAKALAERMEHYQPQLEAYRRAVALLSGLPEENIATRLVFTTIGRVFDI